MPNRLAHETSLSRLSGVYQIRCISTGKIYVGSTANLKERWYQHRRTLRLGPHHNLHLQSAWDKYGEANFVFSVLELVERSDLLRTEQAWIDTTSCVDPNKGFNIFETAGSPGDTYAQIWEGFVDPEGNEVTIINLFEYCRRHNLDFPSMHRLAMGKSKLKSYKGWTHRNSPRKRAYVKTYEGFIAPDGHPVGPITNLAAFCRENRLNNTHMVAVVNGRLYSHHGWTYANGKSKQGSAKTYTGFVNPDGQGMTITNLAAFCREQGLQPVHMFQLINGQRQSHKGWTWRNGDE